MCIKIQGIDLIFYVGLGGMCLIMISGCLCIRARWMMDGRGVLLMDRYSIKLLIDSFFIGNILIIENI